MQAILAILAVRRKTPSHSPTPPLTRSAGYLKDNAYFSLPPHFAAPAAVPGFTDAGMPLARKIAAASPPIAGFVSGDQHLDDADVCEKYFYEEDGVTKERYGQQRMEEIRREKVVEKGLEWDPRDERP